MKRVASLTSLPLRSTSHRNSPLCIRPTLFQCLHSSPSRFANPLPITATGPPPAAPIPTPQYGGERIDRQRRQAEMVKKGQEMRESEAKPGSAIKKRFWKDVSVKQDEDKNHTIHLDTRPVRNPSTKNPLLIPPSKPALATAIALEWDLLTSAQQALRSHLIPLTSLASRAQLLALEDAAAAREGYAATGSKGEGIRYDIVNTLLKYLDTDTLLCWAEEGGQRSAAGETLRELQVRIARPILGYLTQKIWPGVELRPALDDGSILPRSQPPATRAVIKGWMAGLPAWELVGLERATLAGKSLVIAARLVAEWSEELGFEEGGGGKRFGIEEAAEACSLEVKWQTGNWGEVEDSHDVEKEDVRRQFGSAVLAVSGIGGSG